MKSVVHSFGMVVMVLAAVMAFAGLVSLYLDGIEACFSFLISSLLVLFAGGGLALSTLSASARELSRRNGYVLLFLLWLGLPPFAALPFWLGPWSMAPQMALFEAVSALTTTGFTVVRDLPAAAPSLLFWRALLQWAGGLMTVVLLVVFLSALRVGGLQLFRSALPHGEGGGSTLERLRATAAALLLVYAGLTLICAACLWLTGMSGFDAVCLALSTLSTGGFVTAGGDEAMARPAVQFVLIVFMIVAAMNLTTLWAVANRRPRSLRQDPEARYLLATWGGLALLATVMMLFGTHDDPAGVIWEAIFLTTSGLSTAAFVDPEARHWALLSPVLIYGLLFAGGCTASSTGGMRLLRIAVLFKLARRELYRLNHPHGVLPTRFGERRIDDETIWGVWSYFFALVGFTAVSAVALSAFGLEPTAAIAAAVAALTNAGPFADVLTAQLGPVVELPEGARAVLMASMLSARLELLTLLALLSPAYWRR